MEMRVEVTGMLKRRARYLAWLIMLLLLSIRPIDAVQIPAGMHSCASLAECMKLLDCVASRAGPGMGPAEEDIRGILKQFGEPAKHELLRRAAGNDRGWRHLAGAILWGWGSWTPSDVPELRSALLKDPGGWLARPLGEIGTPEAIRALVEDLPKGSDNQTDFALGKLGPKAVPFLMPLLEREKTAKSAQRVISQMDDSALPFASDWAQCATDPSQPMRLRLAALRGIAALGSKAKSASETLPALLSSSDPALRAEAESTLKAIRSPAVIRQVTRSCYPRAGQFDPLAIDGLVCLREIAAYGQDGQGAGHDLLPFLSSKNGDERAAGITTLAAIGYKSALPEIETALSSPDWRVTYAAVRGIGWLGDEQALPDLEKVASSHWLPEVRDEATRTMAALRSPKGRLEVTWKFIPSEGVGEPFEIDHEILGKTPSCNSQRWTWSGTTFKLRPDPQAPDAQAGMSLEFSGGRLEGVNHGEFGGTLTWQRADRRTKSQVIFRDDVVGMTKDGDGAMVLFGLAHMGLAYGYVLRVLRTSGDDWNLSEVARLPAEADALTTVSPGTFAALSRNRVVVFTQAGILGMAACDALR
jgi:HEAT repeat protein